MICEEERKVAREITNLLESADRKDSQMVLNALLAIGSGVSETEGDNLISRYPFLLELR